MFNYDSSSPSLTNVTISGNNANNNGGGMYNSSSSPSLTNVTISGNKSGLGGGMLNNGSSSPSLTNVTITGNTANSDGGGMFNYSSSPSLTNVTISGNNANNNGGGMHNYNSNPAIDKSIIWGNSSPIRNVSSGPEFSNSLIQDSNGSGTNWISSIGVDNGGNVDVDPLFADPKDYTSAPTVEGDYRLRPESPAISGGMGAYELTIAEIAILNNLTVSYGTDLASVNLPTGVSVTLSDRTTPNIPVVWDNGTPTYDGNVVGDYEFKGTLTLPANVGNPDNHKAEVKVFVEPATITSIDSITDLSVAYGTDLANANLPMDVSVTLSDGTTPNIPVVWDNGTPTYDGNVAGDYEFKGTLDLPSNVENPDNHKVEVKVKVLPKPIRPSPPTLYPEATLTVDQPLTEDQLDGSKITIRVSDTYFMNTLVPEHIELHNAPKGLKVSNVERINSTTAIITFTFDGKKLDKAYDLGLTIQSAGLTTWYNVKADNTIHIEKSEGPPYKVIIKEGTFDPTKVWTVTLSGEVDAATVQDALYTEDEAGTRIPVIFTSDGKTIFINPPAGNYLDGSYTLYITRKLKDMNGKELKESIKMTFTIKSQEEPEIEENYKLITKEGVFEPTKVWALQLSSEVDETTVQDALHVEDELGTRIPTTFTSDGKNIFIEPTAGNYEDGTYTLYITSKLKDKDRNSLKEPIKMVFTIKSEEKPEVLKEYALSSDEAWDLYLLMEVNE